MLMGIDGKPIAPSGPVSPWPQPQPQPEPQRKRRRGMRRWPLFLIASPAAVAIWSGWVALGQMCGFGPVNLLPGIGSGFTLNTAITLPIGVEAYGAYALGAWLLPGAPARARRFARKSAIGSLALGVTGQVIYHLLAAAHRTRAPWPVVMVVACMPVATLGFGAALTHLMRNEDDDETAPETHPEPAPATASDPQPASAQGAPAAAPETRPALASGTRPPDASESPPVTASERAPVTASRRASTGTAKRTGKRAPAAVPDVTPEAHFAAELATGEVPSLRRIQKELRVGQDKARTIRQGLEAAAKATQPQRRDPRVVPIGERQRA